MSGTMIVCLPSRHQGGSVKLNFDGRTDVLQTADHSDSTITFASWYSDVTHEVTPVASGYRLVLTYNLTKRAASPIELPSSMATYKARLVNALEDYNKQAEAGPKSCSPFLIHKFEHQ
jgi:hypothetical protein